MVDTVKDAAVLRNWIQDAEPVELHGHDGRVFDLAFCPVYSGVLASASDDNSVRLWQVADAEASVASKQTGVCTGHKDSVLRVTWHSGGQLIASASADTMVQLWQIPTDQAAKDTELILGTSIQTLQGHPEEVYACEFLEQNNLLSASADRLFLWDLQSGTCLQQATVSQSAGSDGQKPTRWQPGYIFSAKTQPGGSLVASACSDGVLRVWDLRSQHLQSVCSLPLHQGMAAACAWDPHGHCIASVATNGDITALDIRTQQPIWSGKATSGLRDCCYLPINMDNVDCLVAAGTDGALHVCHHPENQGSGAQLHSCQPKAQSLLCVNSSEDGTLLAAAGGVGKVRGTHQHAATEQNQNSTTLQDDSFLIQVYLQEQVICV